jgi:hypothetical protein
MELIRVPEVILAESFKGDRDESTNMDTAIRARFFGYGHQH